MKIYHVVHITNVHYLTDLLVLRSCFRDESPLWDAAVLHGDLVESHVYVLLEGLPGSAAACRRVLNPGSVGAGSTS